MDLEAMLKQLPPVSHPDLLQGPVHGADAGVFKLTDELAIVQSADYFPPHIADAHAFGQVAAANSLSDIYAMGARPITALNLLTMPKSANQAQILAIMNGAREKLDEAGVTMLGGHTVSGRTISFGLSVTGVVHPDRLIRNTTPELGDVLVLTKPLGSGIYVHAHGTGDVNDHELYHDCVWVMAELNKVASELLHEHNVHASTDVTGFGLIGHALDMLSTCGLGFELEFSKVPLLPKVKLMAEAGNVPGGSRDNASFTDCKADYAKAPELARAILNDAQTSGGLLVTLSPADAERYIAALAATGYPYGAVVIGRCVAEHAGMISVL